MLLPDSVVAQATITVPIKGLVITSSARVEPGRYTRPAGNTTAAEDALITVRGSNITVDLTGVELIGTAAGDTPDAGKGLALFIDGGENVTIRGLRARGYKIAIMARGTRNLVLEGNDLSHNWKPRLFSVVEHESLVDWLSYHNNEEQEWHRFGAGIYLDGVTGGSITRNKVEQGMNGLLMNRTDSLQIRDNDFSSNSGLGIGMYRSSHNVITGNRVEFNVRGYSHGFYKRGQDSAGILMYEQSMHNIVTGNSVTHGGDGLFLWAGQTTMDTGKGGVNDNLFYDNDFSFSPTNGMEATFSRNDFIANRVEGSDYGLWGGYSYSSRIIANCFANNRTGIAIEHGQDNFIAANTFYGDTLAIRLWANATEPAGWGYPKERDTQSRDYRIARNSFIGNNEVLRVERTTSVDTVDNLTAASGGAPCNIDSTAVPQEILVRLPADRLPRPHTIEATRDRSAIIVDEWGPFDWRSPKLWPIDSVRSPQLRLRVVGPPGEWRTVSTTGLAGISHRSGRTGDTITVTPTARTSATDWELVLEYTGAAVTAPDGTVSAAGVPYRFSYRRYEPVTDWDVRFFEWDENSDPRTKPEGFTQLLAGKPLLERKETRLDYMWYRPTIATVPQTRFAISASAEVSLPAGDHTLRTISDDAVRVWVDDVLVIDHWTPHESALAYATIKGGQHRVRVQYAQIEGWTELRVEFLRGNIRHSQGSDGPH